MRGVWIPFIEQPTPSSLSTKRKTNQQGKVGVRRHPKIAVGHFLAEFLVSS